MNESDSFDRGGRLMRAAMEGWAENENGFDPHHFYLGCMTVILAEVVKNTPDSSTCVGFVADVLGHGAELARTLIDEQS